jgi:hypothetical protein
MSIVKTIGNNTFVSLPSCSGKVAYNVSQILQVSTSQEVNTNWEEIDPETDKSFYPVKYTLVSIQYGNEWNSFVVEGENFVKEIKGYNERTYTRAVLSRDEFEELVELFGLE